jgi:hypothetical protein
METLAHGRTNMAVTEMLEHGLLEAGKLLAKRLRIFWDVFQKGHSGFLGLLNRVLPGARCRSTKVPWLYWA